MPRTTRTRWKEFRKLLRWHFRKAPGRCFKVKCVVCNKKGYDNPRWNPVEADFQWFIEDEDRDEGYLCYDCAPDPDPPTGDPDAIRLGMSGF
tara:strand:+ start:311 stop:586 length:276 start_codon:yes stop_codon:yes gene_type:complete